ncbi:DUF86 domain-containing protein [Echinicola soli]|uniref:DUF86 domain-containing protein n=1 Tax=Echinicola soli TaxID=2591634 RepID=A0A514CP60_9BACT|nr:DUF86 domain-containing protein [Echinicola soli]
MSLRNCLVHSYDRIDDSIIWPTIKSHLKPLKHEAKTKLK